MDDYSIVQGREKNKPHAVCMPYPAQGHINAMLKVAKLLHFKGFHITFVHSENNYNRIRSSSSSPDEEIDDGFRFEVIPDSLPWISDSWTEQLDTQSLSVALRTQFASPFRDLVKRLNGPSSSSSGGGPPVTCIVSDCVTSFTLEVAEEIGVPDVMLSSFSACGFMGFFYLKELAERGLVPALTGEEDDLLNGHDLDTPIDWMPGMENMRLRDMPSFVRASPRPDANEVYLNFCKDEIQDARRATAIILNTFDELEEPILNAMRSILPPLYCIGPLNLLCSHYYSSKILKSIGGSMWKEDTSCIDWLDERPPGSVIYVNFGSIATMTSQQLVEFGWGVANSGHDFLWIIRPDAVVGDSTALPREFLSETSERGLLTSWCPQEEVLRHPSVGGFLTHSGWNSTVEAISAGVPMICWPFFADQQPNCRYACANWEIGIELDGDVRREEVEEKIREVMGGAKGKEMRRMALRWKESAARATGTGGKSVENFERVIKEVLNNKDG